MVTHGPHALYPIARDVIVVWLSKDPPLSDITNVVITATDFFPDATERHRRLSGHLGAHVIFRYLETLAEKPESITICAYRKFISKSEYGDPAWRLKDIPASHYHGSRFISPDMQKQIAAFPDNAQDQLLVSPMRRLKSILTQYSHAHSIDDLLLFTTACVKSKAISKSEAMTFLAMSDFITGGLELGTYPYKFWRDSAERMISGVEYFLANYSASDDVPDQQSRAIAFCAERLGSFFLLQHFAYGRGLSRWPSSYVGFIHTCLVAQVPRRAGLSLIAQYLRHSARLTLSANLEKPRAP